MMRKIFLLISIISVFALSSLTFAQDSKVKIHIVQPQETAYKIARQYGISLSRLYELNPNAKEKIIPGQELIISQDNKKDKKSSQDVYHAVESGETLYSIARQYNVRVDAIKKVNPSIPNWDKLAVGVIIKIPSTSFESTQDYPSSEVHTKTPSQPQEENTASPQGLKVYNVQKGQTIYNLLSITGWSEAELYKFNPILEKGLKAGQTILIPDNTLPTLPLAQTDKQEKNQLIVAPSSEVIKVALALPFKEDNSSKYIEFYEGFLLALKHQKDQGINVDLTVLDCSNPELSKAIDELSKTKDLDIIIGGVSDTSIHNLSQVAQKVNARYVIPFSSRTLNRSYATDIFQINSPHKETYKLVSEKFVKRFPGRSIVLFNSYQSRSSKDAFTSTLTRYALDKNFKVNNLRPEDKLTGDELLNLSNSIGKIVVVPTSASKEVAREVLEAAADAKNKGADIVVFGYPEWQTFESSLKGLFRKVNSTFYTMFYFDFTDEKYKSFSREFISWYGHSMANIYPRYGLLGYDIAKYFTKHAKSSLAESGGYSNLPVNKGIQSHLFFSSTPSIDNVFYNNGVIFVNYKDGKLTID